jgi:hypothetical protein
MKREPYPRSLNLCSALFVMPALVAGIHTLSASHAQATGLDGRDEHGHDECKSRHARTRCGHPCAINLECAGNEIGWP